MTNRWISTVSIDYPVSTKQCISYDRDGCCCCWPITKRARAATALHYEEEAIGRRGKLISSDLIFHIQRQRLLLLGGPSYIAIGFFNKEIVIFLGTLRILVVVLNKITNNKESTIYRVDSWSNKHNTKRKMFVCLLFWSYSLCWVHTRVICRLGALSAF
jgi:hypothetical protein